ncbi:outer membrane protein OmpW [Vibrio profundum]|uniref:outer membrane protein OmpW n=1 Tax=Vibrio profundum TaxID=2910247 RepID=UPI003D13A1FF
MKKTICGAAVLAALLSTSAFAHKEGDFIVRAGLASVVPNDSSGSVLNTASSFSVNSDTQLGLTFGYMLTDNVSVEILAASPFSHDISTNYGNLGDIATVKQLPPTLMAEYYFGNAESKFRPYVGAGINYTTFFDAKLNDTAKSNGLSDLSLSDSWGLAANVGADYMINDSWFVNASAWYAQIDTDATYKAGNTEYTTNVKIDPWVFMIGGGYKF